MPLGAFCAFLVCHSFLSAGVFHVLLLSSYKQMARIEAGWNVARMAYVKAVRDLADKLGVSDAMNGVTGILEADLAVSAVR